MRLVGLPGMADPNFTQAFFLDERLKTHFFLDGIVCLADAKNLPAQLARTPADDGEQKKQGLTVINEVGLLLARGRITGYRSPSGCSFGAQAVEQLAVADRIILNKTDTVKGAGDLAAVEALIRKINPVAPITRCVLSVITSLLCPLAARSDILRVLGACVLISLGLAVVLPRRTQFSRVPDLDAVLGIKAFSLETALKRDKGFLDFRCVSSC